jgi:hypothetical protein
VEMQKWLLHLPPPQSLLPRHERPVALPCVLLWLPLRLPQHATSAAQRRRPMTLRPRPPLRRTDGGRHGRGTWVCAVRPVCSHFSSRVSEWKAMHTPLCSVSESPTDRRRD